MRRRAAVLGTLGALLTVVSAGFAFVPDLLLAVGPVRDTVRALSGTDPTAVVLAATVVVALYVAVAARSSAGESSLAPRSDADRRFDGVATTPPEAVTADRRGRTAAALDAEVDAAVEFGGHRLASVRDVLARTAADVVADHRGTDPATAREAVETGTWTDDDVAAAFLAGEAGPTPALGSRIRLWLAPERERRRRIERTVDAIRALAGERR